MSITITQAERYECSREGCTERFASPESIRGSYCSTACADRDRGQDVIDHLRRDHRFCGTCLRPRKVVYRPADADVEDLRRKALLIRESFVGFETLTEHAHMGPHGIECRCGAIDHRGTESWLRDGEPWEWWLLRAVDQLRHEGQWQYRLDIETLANAVWDDQDLPLALGRALSTPD